MTDREPPPEMRDILAAARRLDAVARRTPLEYSIGLSDRAGAEVYLKLENLQRTGSFKLRGAYNALAAEADALRPHGVVTASAGNHGLGIALAARLSQMPATVFVPESAPGVKRNRIARLGTAVREVRGDYDDAHAAAEALAAETGARYLHAFSDPRVVAGQGTVGLEIFEQLPEVRTLLVPVGGGGLIGGIGIVARALDPDVEVIGAQSTATAAMHASLRAGRLESPPMGTTLCDGLSGDIDARSLALARRVVDRMVLVEEDTVRDAIRWLYAEEGVVAEGSGAVTVAALRAGLVPDLHGPIVVIVSGGNIDAPVLAEILGE